MIVLAYYLPFLRFAGALLFERIIPKFQKVIKMPGQPHNPIPANPPLIQPPPILPNFDPKTVLPLQIIQQIHARMSTNIDSHGPTCPILPHFLVEGIGQYDGIGENI